MIAQKSVWWLHNEKIIANIVEIPSPGLEVIRANNSVYLSTCKDQQKGKLARGSHAKGYNTAKNAQSKAKTMVYLAMLLHGHNSISEPYIGRECSSICRPGSWVIFVYKSSNSNSITKCCCYFNVPLLPSKSHWGVPALEWINLHGRLTTCTCGE